MRVMPRWRAERVGYVTDLEAWVPMADGEEPAAPAAGDADEEPVTGITVPIRLEYEINAGRAPSKYLRGIAEDFNNTPPVIAELGRNICYADKLGRSKYGGRAISKLEI